MRCPSGIQPRTEREREDGQRFACHRWTAPQPTFWLIRSYLADSLGKGDRVMVTGRLRQRSWETPRGRGGR
jgi:hypothetical protein